MIKILVFVFSYSSSVCLYAENTLQGQALNTPEEINLLISSIEDGNCSFHRNGNIYSAKEAAKHLHLKLSRGARYAKTTEKFIENLASKSSFSGKPYYIECQHGELISMEAWLNTELAIMRSNVDQ